MIPEISSTANGCSCSVGFQYWATDWRFIHPDTHLHLQTRQVSWQWHWCFIALYSHKQLHNINFITILTGNPVRSIKENNTFVISAWYLKTKTYHPRRIYIIQFQYNFVSPYCFVWSTSEATVFWFYKVFFCKLIAIEIIQLWKPHWFEIGGLKKISDSFSVLNNEFPSHHVVMTLVQILYHSMIR